MAGRRARRGHAVVGAAPGSIYNRHAARNAFRAAPTTSATSKRWSSIACLTPADYRRMPWKNGGGRTDRDRGVPGLRRAGCLRLADQHRRRDAGRPVFPLPWRRPDDGRWSRAQACGSRATDRRVVAARCLSEPYAFSGDDANSAARCSTAPVRDFNLMLRRGRARGAVTVVPRRGTRARAGAIPPLLRGERRLRRPARRPCRRSTMRRRSCAAGRGRRPPALRVVR